MSLFGGSPFKWSGKDWGNFAMGGPQMAQAGQNLADIRGNVNPPSAIDPIFAQNALNLAMTPDNPLMQKVRERYVKTLTGAGKSDAAAQALAARKTNQGFLSLADTSGGFLSALQSLAEETKRQRESIGSTPSPEAAQFSGFFGNL
jgi:hypothetical protein